MNVLRSPFFRPASRPSSPAPTSLPTQRAEPVSVHSTDRTTGPLNRLALNNFRRPSPATTKPSQDSPTPLVRDGSYLEVLSLKLSEAVSRALAQPAGPALAYEVVAGRRPLPPGRGHVLGQLIALYVSTLIRLVIYLTFHFQGIKDKSEQSSLIPCNYPIASSPTVCSAHRSMCSSIAAAVLSSIPFTSCIKFAGSEYQSYSISCSRFYDVCTRTS